MSTHIRALTCLTLLCFWMAAALSAQRTNARISGVVFDASGALISGAAITIENTATGITLSTTSNAVGVYEFPSLQPGPYRLTGRYSGFQTFEVAGLVLQVSAQARQDLTMRVASVAETIQVTADLTSPIAATTPSVGGVIDGDRILDLPVAERNALGLVDTQAGVITEHFNGERIGTNNVSHDGINVMNQFENSGVNSVIYESTDIAQEIRIVTSPADAELGPGSGQVLISTRSGTNEFHGSLFESVRNTSLNANTWFNNQSGVPRNTLNRNQFGVRVGGPILKRKTFFHFLYDGQREVTKNNLSPITPTATARQGVFRFFPGAQNGNFNAAVPTVDLLGNPVKPATATGNLQSVSILGRDPNRPAMDSTGTIQKLLDLMPLPNNFRIGDGLNTAGYNWTRRVTNDRDQYNVRIDHHLNESHRLNFSWTHETSESVNGYAPQFFPQSPGGSLAAYVNFYSFQITSALSPSILNEFHAGSQRRTNRSYAAFELEGKTLYPSSNGVRYVPNISGTGVTNVIPLAGPHGDFSPLTVWGDNLSWSRGRHTFKFGGEARLASYDAYVEDFRMPRVVIGPGGVAVTGISTITSIGANQNAAQNLLNLLAGSVGTTGNTIRQNFYESGIVNPTFLSPKEGEHANGLAFEREFSLFFKDDWKILPDLTLNLGLRYEFYGVPWARDPHTGESGTINLVGGSKGLFGWSGNSPADLYQPGTQRSPLTTFEFVGPGSPHPDRSLYKDDWNNFAPAVGFSWSLPYFGRGKTILRAGYSVGYERLPLFLHGNVSGGEPDSINAVNYSSSQYLDLSRLPLPLSPTAKPFEVVPLTDRSQNVSAYDSNLRIPYVQNWNLTIQRELPGRMSIDLRYVGGKGTKLIRQANINEVNIFESGILDAFLVTQAGGNSPLLDKMFNGLTVAPSLGPVNGTTVTASQSLRSNTTTNAMLANNNAGAFANFLNTTTNFTGIAGELIRRAGLPENLIVANPQFLAANLAGNFANSTHHALQVEWNKRFSNGWTLQSNYTWGRTLGETPGDGSAFVENGFRNLRDRHIEKRLQTFHRTHVFRTNGLFELPIGPGRRFLSSNGSILSRLMERWQVGAVVNLFSGSPIGLVSQTSTLNQNTNNTPDLVRDLPKSFGEVSYDAAGVIYFQGVKLAPDPAIAGLTTQQSLNARSTLLSLADADGNWIAVNPKPGKLGNMYSTYLEGPGSVRFDLNVVKRIRIGEKKEFELRADAINILNRVNFANPNSDINSLTFGRITSTTGDNRIIELHGRIRF